MKARAAWIAVLLLAGVVLAGCGGEGSASGSSDGDGIIRLTYWSSQNPQERALAEELTEAWNRAHPGIQVTVQPLPAGQSSEEVLLAAVVAGTTPDLCSNIWPGIVGDLQRAGGVVALDTMPGFEALMQKRLPEGLLENFRSPDGRVYQIPWKTNPIMMLYNKRLLREAGFSEPPATYRAYLDAARRVTADTNGDGYADRWMGYRDIRPIWYERYFDYYSFYIGASGGETLFQNGELSVDADASNAVFGFFQALYENGYFPTSTLQGSAFVAGNIATEFTGPWSIAWLEENAPPGLDYAYAPLPTPAEVSGPVYTYGDYKNIAIFSSTEHPEAAWRFARHLVSEEADQLLLEITRQIPVRKNLLSDSTFADFFAQHPQVVPFAQQAPHTRGVDDVGALPEILDAIAQQFEAAAVYHVRPPEEATRRALDRIRLIRAWSE